MKNKKTPGKIIILLMCPINDNHILYGFWDMERNEHNFLSFWTVFCPFYPHNKPENQNFEKRKKYMEILLFCTSVSKIMIICYRQTTRQTEMDRLMDGLTNGWTDRQTYGEMDRQTNRWTDRWTEKVTYWDGCPI